MAKLKRAKFGLYGTRNRSFQKRVSYERISMSGHTAFFYKFLGDALGDSLNHISDPVLMEITDREYDPEPIEINVNFDNDMREQVDLSHLGILNPLAGQKEFQFHSLSFEEDGLGRYPMEGDIFAIPDMASDDFNAYFEVQSVDRKNEHETYTIIVHAEPVKSTTQIMGVEEDFEQDNNEDNLVGIMGEWHSEASESVPESEPDQEEVYGKVDGHSKSTVRDDFLDNLTQIN